MHKATLGENEIQSQLNSESRAQKFYKNQMQQSLSDRMISLIQKLDMVFISTSDKQGNCDCSPRFGQKGFVQILDSQTLVYPEFRGNGVFASLGNIFENPHIGMVFIDFFETTVGLHVNGRVDLFSEQTLPEVYNKKLNSPLPPGIKVEQWVVIHIDEAYIHCSKHVPLLKKQHKNIKWGTDSPKEKSEGYFKTN